MLLFSVSTVGILLAGLFCLGQTTDFNYTDPKVCMEGSCGSYIRPSPINIDTDSVVYGKQFTVEYNDVSSALQSVLDYIGHAPSFSFDEPRRILSLSSVPGFGDATFELRSFHIHFAHNNSMGSEHKIDGAGFPSEMHFVHTNTKYDTEEAVKHSDGLAVIGVFLKVSDTANPELVKLTDQMKQVIDKGAKIPLSVTVNLNLLMPTLTKVMTYPGSMTTPPYSEVVQWLVTNDPMPITSEQLKIMRDLRTRPLQPTNGRKVYANFEKE